MKRLILAAFAACFAVPVWAQDCTPRAEIVAVITEKHKESRQAIALVHNGVMIEFFASETGTWTAVVTDEFGCSMVVSYGEAFQLTDGDIPLAGEPV